MTNKIKMFLVFLAVSAIFSVFSFSDVFRGVRSASLIDASKTLLLDANMGDDDQDGLSDSDES